MTAAGASAEPPSEVRVLILYQYDSQAADRPPKLVEETARLLATRSVGGYTVRCRTLREAMAGAVESTFWQHYLEAVAGSFDYAIAFLTHDRRPASSAGNLWLEVGYWLARRGGSSLLLVREVPPEPERALEVRPPSNLGGFPYLDASRAEQVFAELSDLVDKTFVPGRAEVDRFSSRFREELRSSPWTQIEEEHVRLEAPVAERQAERRPAPSGSLRCTIESTRRGSLPRAEIKIGIAVEPARLPEGRYGFTWLLGAGVSPHAAGSRVAAPLTEERIDERGVGDLLHIERLHLRIGGDAFDYRLRSHDRGSGWAALTFTADLPDGPYPADTALELRISTWVSRADGWYHYFAPRSVRDRLVVSLSAPFRVVPVPTILPSFARREHRGAWFGAGTRARYESRFDIDGPVFAGSQIFWVFAPEPGEEQSMAAKKKTTKKKASKKKTAKKKSAAKKAMRKTAKKKLSKKKARRRPARRANGGGGSGGGFLTPGL